MKKITIILPTYNEKENIGTLISAIVGVFQKLDKYILDILVVDDYSPDGTARIIDTLCNKFKQITLLSKKREGLGAAITHAMTYTQEHLKPDIVILMDADWSHNPLLIPEFIKAYENGADFVVGSRYIKGGSIPGNWGLHRKIFSITGNTIVRLGLGLTVPHDWTSGFRLMNARVINKVLPGLETFSGYTFQVAFLHKVKLSGFTVTEVPIQFIDRVHGRSKIAPFDYIKNVLLYVLNNSHFLKYLVIGTLGFTVQTAVSKLLIIVNTFPGLAVSVGAFFAIVTNFLGNNLWTFVDRKITGLGKLLPKFFHFLITSSGALFIQFVVVSAGVLILGEGAWFPLMVFAIVFLVIPYNYFLYKYFIWRNDNN